jgi:hypothetical protein
MGNSFYPLQGVNGAPPLPLSWATPIALPPLGVAPPALGPLMVASALSGGPLPQVLDPAKSFPFEEKRPQTPDEVLRDLENFWRLHGEGKKDQRHWGRQRIHEESFSRVFHGLKHH